MPAGTTSPQQQQARWTSQDRSGTSQQTSQPASQQISQQTSQQTSHQTSHQTNQQTSQRTSQRTSQQQQARTDEDGDRSGAGEPQQGSVALSALHQSVVRFYEAATPTPAEYVARAEAAERIKQVS
jgi:hypothetical protein